MKYLTPMGGELKKRIEKGGAFLRGGVRKIGGNLKRGEARAR